MSLVSFIAQYFVPASEKARQIFEVFIQFSTRHFRDLTKEVGEEKAKSMYSEVARELGNNMGLTLAHELRLQIGSPESAVRAWRIAGKTLGFKMVVHHEGCHVDFEHPRDPLWEQFKKEGLFLCESTCVPMTTEIARTFYPEARVEFVKEPTSTASCVKRLILKENCPHQRIEKRSQQ